MLEIVLWTCTAGVSSCCLCMPCVLLRSVWDSGWSPAADPKWALQSPGPGSVWLYWLPITVRYRSQHNVLCYLSGISWTKLNLHWNMSAAIWNAPIFTNWPHKMFWLSHRTCSGPTHMWSGSWRPWNLLGHLKYFYVPMFRQLNLILNY